VTRLLICLTLLAPGLWAQDQEVSETQSVIVVEAPVQVVRNGDPVRGLTAENFEIYDRGEKQTITRFEARDFTLSAAAEAETAEAPAKQRHFMLFFDLFFISRQGVFEAIEAARALLDEGLGPADRVAIAIYHPNRGARLLTGFTTDRDVSTLALDALEIYVSPRRDVAKAAVVQRRLAQNEAVPARQGETDPLMMARVHVKGEDGKFGWPLQPKFDAAREALVHHSNGDRAAARIHKRLAKLAFMKRIGTPRADSSGVLSMACDLAMLVNAYRGLEGVKFLVFYSEGYSNQLLAGDTFAAMVRAQMERMLDVARICGWAFHTVDVKGLRPGGANLTQDSMTQLAMDTGGKFYRNYNDLEKAMTRMVESVSVTYILAFQPSGLEFDGAYHPIKVKLKGARGRIQYQREGYFAPVRGAELIGQTQLDASKKAEMIMGDAEGGLLDMSAIAAVVGYDGMLARAPVLVEVRPDSFEDYGPASQMEIETYVYARDAEGGIPDFFVHTLQLDRLGDRRAALEEGLLALGELELPPGDYTLRVMVYDRRSGEYALKSVPLAVPRFGEPGPALYAPLWVGPANRGLVAREGDGALPFRASGRKFLPSALPVVNAKERILLQTLVANPNPSLVNLSHRILDDEGFELDAHRRLRPKRGSEYRDEQLFSAVFQLDVKGLEPGKYVLEITLSQTDPDVMRTSRLPFIVQ